MHSNNDEDSIVLGFYTMDAALRSFPCLQGSSGLDMSGYIFEKGGQWHISCTLMNNYHNVNGVCCQLTGGGPLHVLRGSTHDAFFKALTTRLAPRFSALKNVLSQYLLLVGTQYEEVMRDAILKDLSVTDFERQYLKQFLPMVVKYLCKANLTM